MTLKFLKKKFLQFLSKIWPFAIIILFVGIFFNKVFINKLVPIPGDFIVGTYFPWLDYKWGYSVGVPVKNPITSDVVSIIYPLRSFAVDMIKEGHLALWNRFMFAGSPLLADFQIAIFSPTIIFYFLLPKIWAWTAQVIAQPILAAIFTYLLLRNFKLNKIASLFGGIFYAFSAFNIIWMEWNTNTLTAAFIPLLILLLDKLISSGKLYWGLLFSVAICLQIFSGYPQVVIFTMMALFAYFIFRFSNITKKKTLRIIFFILIGVSLSSVIIIPGAEHILNSQRDNSLLSADLIYLPWRHLITFLAPDYFGNPASYNYFGAGNYAINAGYSGVVILILAILGIKQHWNKFEVKYFAMLFLASLLLALPTPLAKALFYSPIPGIAASSNTRILVLANLTLAVLAGFGISSLFVREKIRKAWITFLPLAILLIILIFTFGRPDSTVSIRNLILPIFLSVTVPVIIMMREKLYSLKYLRIVLVLLLCLLGVAELYRYGWKYTPFSSPDLVFPKTPILTYFENEKEPFRISPGNVIPMNMWVPYNLESISGYDAAYPAWWARLYNVISSQNTIKTSYSYYAGFEKYKDRWFDLLNNKYILVLAPKTPSGETLDNALYSEITNVNKFEKVFQDKSVVIFKNNKYMPRAIFVSDWEVETEEESLSLLIDPEFPIFTKIVINKETNLEKSESVNSTVSYNFYSSEKSIINVETNKEGFLFITDEWYPGWVAKVDGVKAPIYRADYAFRAIPVPQGSHEVEFYYEPNSFKIGLIISGVSLLVLVIVWVFRKQIYK